MGFCSFFANGSCMVLLHQWDFNQVTVPISHQPTYIYIYICTYYIHWSSSWVSKTLILVRTSWKPGKYEGYINIIYTSRVVRPILGILWNPCEWRFPIGVPLHSCDCRISHRISHPTIRVPPFGGFLSHRATPIQSSIFMGFSMINQLFWLPQLMETLIEFAMSM